MIAMDREHDVDILEDNGVNPIVTRPLGGQTTFITFASGTRTWTVYEWDERSEEWAQMGASRYTLGKLAINGTYTGQRCFTTRCPQHLNLLFESCDGYMFEVDIPPVGVLLLPLCWLHSLTICSQTGVR